MGRSARRPKAPPSGAVIFYGQSTQRDRSKQHQSNAPLSTVIPPPRKLQHGPTSPQLSIRSIRSSDTSSGDSSYELFDNASLGTSVSSLSEASDLNRNKSSILQSPTLRDNVATTIALIKFTVEMFQSAPYIEVIAGAVLQIIQIADEIQTNKDRNIELIDKVTSYARVVFEALQSPQIRLGTGLDDLKEDLLQIASVLESIYQILQSSTNSTFSARFSRVVRREEILGRIEEQDRRLDTSITSFQLKSSIVLRTTNVYPVAQQAEPMPPPIRTRRSNKLRTKPQIMFGRDNEIESIVTMILGEERSHLAILGPGGIGKTSLALSVIHDTRVLARFGDDRIFVSCEAATCVDHVILDMALALQISPDNINGQLLDAVLDRLQQSPFLVILDNFETPWELPGARLDVESFLQDLTALERLTVIVTMRGSQHPAGVEWSHLLPPLQPVDLESATEIFRTISKKMDEHAISLIQVVDRVPLAVTLLANLAAVDGETTEALLHRWHQETVGMVENGNDRLTSLDCSVQVSISSPRMHRDPDALSFLSLLSLLPDGMSSETYHSFDSGFPGIPNVKKAVSTLRQNALIFMDFNGSIKILSPIRLYMRAHRPPSPEPRRSLQDYFLDLAFQGTLYSDLVVKKRLCAEAENIEAMLVDSLQFNRPVDTVAEAILNFCHHTYVNGVSSTGGLSLAIEIFQQLPPSTTQVLPSTSKRHTPRLRRFGGLQFWKSTQIEMQDVQGCEVNQSMKLHGDCLGCWGQILTRQSRFKEAEEKFILAIQIHVQAGDTAGHAYDLHNLGCLLSRKSATFPEAQARLLEATKLHEQINDRIGCAYDLMGLGQVLLQQSQLLKAATAFTDALYLFLEYEDELGAASALTSLGQVTLCSSKFKESEGHFSRALQLNIKMGNVVGEAESLAGLAYTLLLRSRFPEAKQRIEEALAVRAPIEDPDHLHVLGRVLIAQCQFDEASRVILRAQTLHQKYDDELGSADDTQFLCHILAYNGSLKQAGYDLISLHELYLSQDNSLGRADVLATRGMVRTRRSKLHPAQSDLTEALQLHIQIGSLLGQAYDLHHIGCLHLRRGEIDDAIESLQKALALHIEVENVQGQADDLNQLAEASLRRQCHNDALTGVCQALALHIQIGDLAGQGDDLYVQACVFLEQLRLLEAEETILKAHELHSQSGIIYGQARDLATLSSVLWQKFKSSGAIECRAEAITALEKAIDMFYEAGAPGECDHCLCKLQEMEEEVPHKWCRYVNHSALDA